MLNRITHWVLTGALLLSGAQALAGQGQVKPDGSVTWAAGVDGVEIEWAPNGSVRRIYSKHSTPVEFADRRGISKGQIIAEEKAKANIIRFMGQTASTTRVVAEVQADINKMTQKRETDKASNVKKVDERIMLESLTEVTTSFASGKLKGVIVLERGYDAKTQEAWTVVGISDRTIGAAQDVKEMSEATGSRQNNQPQARSGPSNMGEQGSEVKVTRQKQW